MIYTPDFDEECFLCGTSPTVVVEGHTTPNTKLCGYHFFKDHTMVDWEEWNNQPDETE
jgi:hypothetical protein